MRLLARLFALCFLTQLSAAALDHSIAALVEELESGSNLNPQKYSSSQYQEITSALKLAHQKVRVMSYNMLFDIYDLNLDIENRWPSRLPRIVTLIETLQPDILCVQELQKHQIDDLLKKIGEKYSFSIDKDSKAKGFGGIFYKKDRFSLLESRKWQSCEMIHLFDCKTEEKLRVFNTHLPFSDIDKRENTVLDIARIIAPYTESEAVILAGDMNTFSNRPDLPNLPFYDGDRIESLLTKTSLENAYRKALLGHVGPISTFTNESQVATPFKGEGTPGIILDHLFVSHALLVLIHGTDPGRVEGHFPSDHMPVFIDLVQIRK